MVKQSLHLLNRPPIPDTRCLSCSLRLLSNGISLHLECLCEPSHDFELVSGKSDAFTVSPQTPSRSATFKVGETLRKSDCILARASRIIQVTQHSCLSHPAFLSKWWVRWLLSVLSEHFAGFVIESSSSSIHRIYGDVPPRSVHICKAHQQKVQWRPLHPRESVGGSRTASE